MSKPGPKRQRDRAAGTVLKLRRPEPTGRAKPITANAGWPIRQAALLDRAK